VSVPRRGEIAVQTLDLREPLRPLVGLEGYARVRVFVMWDGAPLGHVDIEHAGYPVSVTRLRSAIASRLGRDVLRRALAAEISPNGSASTTCLPSQVPVSIVVATRDRPHDLRACLASLTSQGTGRAVEVVVVDNHPDSGLTPPVVRAFPGARHLIEPRRGLSYARNRGILASRGAIIVCVDDDVVAPQGWLEKLIAPFVDDGVMAVTGNVLPSELDTPAQHYFEVYGGLGRGDAPFRADADWFRRFRGSAPTWRLGATANAAFRASAFSDRRIGLFDEALGAGTPTGCSEDTYLFYKILKAGYAIVYQPAAYVWHRHRREMAAFRRQIFDYSKGHVAYHLTTLLRDGDLRALIRLGLQLPQTYVWRLRARGAGTAEYPPSLILLEIAGNLLGPWALLQSRLRVRRLGPSRKETGRR
jgi:GT2 family glycosyltransferase